MLSVLVSSPSFFFVSLAKINPEEEAVILGLLASTFLTMHQEQKRHSQEETSMAVVDLASSTRFQLVF